MLVPPPAARRMARDFMGFAPSLSLMWARFSMPDLGLDWTEADRVPSLTKKMIFCLAGNKRDSDRPILSSGAKKLISPTGTPTWLVETSRCLSFFGIQAADGPLL